MSTLHVLSHSPFADTRLTSCLRILAGQDAVLLCGDAAYALTADTSAHRALVAQSGSLTLYVLDEDAQARNIPVPEWAKRVDYPGFVELSVKYDKVNTWL